MSKLLFYDKLPHHTTESLLEYKDRITAVSPVASFSFLCGGQQNVREIKAIQDVMPDLPCTGTVQSH